MEATCIFKKFSLPIIDIRCKKIHQNFGTSESYMILIKAALSSMRVDIIDERAIETLQLNS